ncbi:hypothetical protein GGR03_000303 [Aurantimonas endophytica]|uniref:DUF7673 domain-containing protein n=2 Tax=Aurantimonas endophytica TaxID=1522175 RepID=A0A7W6H9V2_9HYPH|nr:hypothetical protein [Aurantimonas endophytica]MBB4001256.1 hypothetical protein [Aurantimonas endophytica]MCO6403096.1 hypothetical protein [Aurantimonas endophytica]
MNDFERAACERLLNIAKDDTGQSRIVANFILAWWNAGSLGGFNLAELFLLDNAISSDIATIVVCLARNDEAFYPTEYRSDIEAVIAQWRPEVWQASR